MKAMKTWAKILLIFGIILSVNTTLVAATVGYTIYLTYNGEHITTDINNYGEYKGTFMDRHVNEYITSFFPEEIEENFTDVKYSYRAKKFDSFAFEAYLEFNIEDTDEYNAYVAKMTKGIEGKTFIYDESFTEYVIGDYIMLSENPETNHVGFSTANIKKILCNQDQQKIIFVAIGVHDGGVAGPDFLSVYFDRFNIDPFEYEKHADNLEESFYDFNKDNKLFR